jgi:hypothetical protein
MRPQDEYFLLVLLRLFVSFAAWGVVHPDELFQSVEVLFCRAQGSAPVHQLLIRCVPAGC